ncbi:MAG TPA: FeoA family protein [Membranihabitans sp.]|nr:FeoA family protein [Membranihabitans sp.]
MTPLTLNQISRNKPVTIDRILESPWSVRLAEMGFIPGSTTAVIRKSPFGSTLYIKLNTSHIALRKKEAAQIIVSTAQ